MDSSPGPEVPAVDTDASEPATSSGEDLEAPAREAMARRGYGARLRATISEVVASPSASLRRESATVLVGLLAAGAATPIIAAALGADPGLTAGVGVVGNVGANILTTVVCDAIARIRAAGERAEPTVEEVRQAVADRVAAAFASVGPVDRDLRGEVVDLFGAVDATRVALEVAVTDAELDTAMSLALVELVEMFGEFAYVLTTTRLGVEQLAQQLRMGEARREADRQHERRAQADIGRILDIVSSRQVSSAMAVPAGVEAAPRRWEGCPYLGLQSFQEHHAAVFYGRRAMTGRLLARLRECLTDPGLLLVLGPSGAGKSSLLRAGLMTALAEDYFVAGSRLWPRRVITPTVDPLLELATHLADMAGIDAMAVHRSLAEHPDRANLLVHQILTRQKNLPGHGGLDDEEPRLVLVVDQLEEMVVLLEDRARQETFLTAVAAIAAATMSDGRPAALVVAAMRGDFLGQAVGFAPVRQSVEKGMFTVTPMGEADLAEAISGPASEAGRSVPVDLVATIIEDLRDRRVQVGFDAGALPLLSQVMFVMWQAGGPAGLTTECYRRVGGVANIVQTSAERAYGGLSTAFRDIARRVFVHLSADVDGTLIRRPMKLSELRTVVGCSPAELDEVLKAFTSQRLLTRSDPDEVTIAHEGLLRSWDRLHGWWRPDPAEQKLHRTVVNHVHTWREHNRDGSYLYSGRQLRQASKAVARWADDLTGVLSVDGTVHEFVAAGKRRQRRRKGVIVGAGIAVAGILLSWMHFAGIDSDLLDQQHAEALSRQLAAHSRNVSSTDWSKAQRLAAAALHFAPTREASEAASVLLERSANIIGQEGAVVALAFSSDGRRLATGTVGEEDDTGTVRMWDATSGRAIRRLPLDHTGFVEELQFSSDGRFLATANGDGTVGIWDPNSGTPVKAALPIDGASRTVAFSPDGKLLAVGSTLNPATPPPLLKSVEPGASSVPGSRNAVTIWDPTTTRQIRPTIALAATVNVVRFSPDGKLVAAAGEGSQVTLANPETGQLIRLLKITDRRGEVRRIDDISFSPDGRLLATFSSSSSVSLWDTVTGESVAGDLMDSISPVAVKFSPVGGLLAVGTSDGIVSLWNLTARKVERSWPAHGAGTLAFSPDGRRLAIGGSDRTTLWDVDLGVPSNSALDSYDSGPSAAFTPDGRSVITTGEHTPDRVTTLALRDINSLTIRATQPVPAVARPGRLIVASDGSVLIGTEGGSVYRWSEGSKGYLNLAPLAGLEQRTLLAVSPDGRIAVTAASTGDPKSPYGVRLWSLAALSRQPAVSPSEAGAAESLGPALAGHTGEVIRATFSADGKHLATASKDDAVRLWDPSTGKPTGVTIRHVPAAQVLALSPDGQYLASVAEDAQVRVWNTTNGTLIGSPAARADLVTGSIVFSPDGKLLATGGEDNAVRLWNPLSGEPVGAPLLGHSGSIGDLAFSHDGRLLVSTAADGSARLWNIDVYKDPRWELCGQAGELSAADWRVYAAGEHRVPICH
ncbi:nSTAND1 domain-containing NTPase [Longispora urticae]